MTNAERGAALVGLNARGLIATRVIVPRPTLRVQWQPRCFPSIPQAAEVQLVHSVLSLALGIIARFYNPSRNKMIANCYSPIERTISFSLILLSLPMKHSMPEREVNSPVNTRNTTSKLRSNQALSAGARSAPDRVGGPKFDAGVPTSQLRTTRAAHQEEPPIPAGATTQVTGPEE